MQMHVWLYLLLKSLAICDGCYCHMELFRKHLVGTIPSLPKVHTVKFSLKPTAKSRGFSNVIHFTLGGNRGFGNRIPGVFMHNQSLYVFGSVNGFGGYYASVRSMPLNKWADVTVVNSKVGSKYFWAVYVNGRKIVETENPTAKVYKNVKLYASDPWYPRFSGSFCNLMIIGEGAGDIRGRGVCPMFLYSNENVIQPKKGFLLGTIPGLPKAFAISFSFQPKSFPKGYKNVLLFTSFEKSRYYLRIPGIWLYNDKLHVSSFVSSNVNYWVNSPPLKKGEWADVMIISTKVGSKYLYEVFFNGKLLVRTVNTSPREYKNVKMYASSYMSTPEHRPFNGSIRNVVVSVPGSFACN